MDDDEILNDHNIQLEMQVDIYNYAFLKFITTNCRFVHKELMLKCMITFVIQYLLAHFVRGERSGLNGVHLGTVDLNATRIICAMILHMSVMSEV